MTKRFINPGKLATFVASQYGEINSIQQHVLDKLTGYAGDQNTRFSKGAIRYLFDEISGTKTEDIAPEKAVEVLGTFLNEMEAQKRSEKEISQAVIVRTLRVFDCPRPWC